MVFSPFVDGTPLPALSDSLGTKRAPSCELLCVKERRVIAYTHLLEEMASRAPSKS